MEPPNDLGQVVEVLTPRVQDERPPDRKRLRVRQAPQWQRRLEMTLDPEDRVGLTHRANG
jgi:hypothetical protein